MNDQSANDYVPITPSSVGDTQSTKKKRGCWKIAAVGCICALLAGAVGGYLAYRGIKGVVTGIAEKYTFSAPEELPPLVATDAECAGVLDRVNEFARALGANDASPPLVLSGRDINILINRHPNWKAMAGKVHVTIDGDQVHGQVSIPLDDLGRMFKGRYLNGTAVFRVGMTAGRLLVFMDSVDVGGKELPEEFLSALRSKNLAEDLNKEPKARALLDKLASITVRDGALILEPKSGRSSPSVQP